MGRASGISAEQIANLNHYRNDFNFSDLERLVLRYADGMTQTPVDVPDALFARLREKFTEAQLVELTSAIAWENYRARFDHAFGIEAESFSEGAVCALPVRTAPVP
ncbi:MAG: carboxymuconolactone decarboxylase family protein [Candidatus Angelobacter sp.]